MEDLLNNTIFKGILFSAFDELGPQPIYRFPKEVVDENVESEKKAHPNKLVLTLRDYTQIAIKNLSLLMRDKESEKKPLKNYQHFGIIPFPDFQVTSITFFHFVKLGEEKPPIQSAFSILVDEKYRSFLFNNHEKIKRIVKNFFKGLDLASQGGFKPQKEVTPLFKELISNLIDLQKLPSTPITTERKMKILFVGLDDSGKTSFLLSVDQKFSKILGIKPTKGASIKSIQALGATIFLWDLGGQSAFRSKYLEKYNIYLYETDLIFYFIDIKNRERFEESIDYLKKIHEILFEKFEQNTPFVFILSKADMDVRKSPEVKKNIDYIEQKLIEVMSQEDLEIYLTSIFEIITILRAFSSGISKLSPNRDLINFNLKKFSDEIGIDLTLLLSNEGLVLADYNSPDDEHLTNKQISKELLLNIFEISAPQFATLYKIFSKFRTLEKQEAIFKVSNSIILIKRISMGQDQSDAFMLFLLDQENKKEKIDKLLPNLVNKIQDLLITYIS